MTRAPSDPTRPAPSGSRVVAVLGPTNTGKTHYAVERMMAHATGMIGLPLRLLAREVYDRVVAAKGAGAVALITGEERIVPEGARYFVCTVEAMPLGQEVACLVVDEIQLIGDRERGHVFTDRLLHARGTEETLFLGAETARGLIRQLLPRAEFQTRTRFSELTYAGSKKLSRLPRRSAIVAFSAEAVYGLAELMRRQRGGAAVVMGALSPRTRNAQVEIYQSGEVDFLVATDAIGMGLNMDVDHVAFASMRKFDGRQIRPLRPHEIGQIAGRAGRHTSDGTFGPTGEASALDAEVIEQIESHRFDPLRTAHWRSRDLDFGSAAQLLESLDAPPPERALTRTPGAVDHLTLLAMADEPSIAPLVSEGDRVRLLWDVCQIPDFRNVMLDEHVRLVTSVFRHLIENGGRLPADWIAGHVGQLDKPEGDIDTLSSRLAHIRTWTYLSHREAWLDDPAHWQAQTRAVEDRLSDALHAALTQSFIDRRTSVLIKRLSQNEELMSAVSADGEVSVEGEYVGQLRGFRFQADTRGRGLDARALRQAATRALRSMMASRAESLAEAAGTALELSDHGRIWWSGNPVARLEAGAAGLAPRVVLEADDLLDPAIAARAQAHLQAWLDDQIARTLPQFMALRTAIDGRTATREETAPAQIPPEADNTPPTPRLGEPAPGEPATEPMKPTEPEEKADTHNEEEPNNDPRKEGLGKAGEEAAPPLSGMARGIAFRLIEGYGNLDRREANEDIRALTPPERAALRRYGVRFGEHAVFLPALLKPAAARLLTILWAVSDNRFRPDAPVPSLPAPGLCSVPVEKAFPRAFYAAAGFRVLGRRAVRIDMLERLADVIRKARETAAPKVAARDAEAAPQARPENDAEAAQAGGTSPSEPGGTSAPQRLTESHETMPVPEETAASLAPAPSLPRGAFCAGAEMMSLVGCSGEDFESILRALGYRPLTIPAQGEAGDSITAWRFQTRRPRPAREEKAGQSRDPDRRTRSAPGGAGGKDAKGTKGSKWRKGGGPAKTGKGPKGPRRFESAPPAARGGNKNRGPDPDSPFAALAALKDTLKK